MSIEDCEKALHKLQQPDKYSRSREYDGRRVEVVEGGWLILNRAKYRDLIPDEHRREQDRLRQRRHREKQWESDLSVSRVTGRDSHETSRKTEKETEEKNLKPFAKSAEEDPRHSLIRDEICELWLAANNEIPAAPWDGHEGKLLERFLRENPCWTLEICLICIRNRFSSEVNHSERPSRWIPDLSAYASGPLDRFKQPLSEGGLSKAQQRSRRNRSIIRRDFRSPLDEDLSDKRPLFAARLQTRRLGSIDIKKDWDTVLMVLLDENFEAGEIYEAERTALLNALTAPGSKARNERGALSVSKFKSIAKLRWSRDALGKGTHAAT